MKISPMTSSIPAPTPSADPNTIKMATKYVADELPPMEGEEKPPVLDNNEANRVEAIEPISPEFAALAKQRRAFQQERKAFLEEKRAYEAAKSQGGDSVTLSDILKDPLGVYTRAGVTYEQLAEAIQNQGSPEVLALKSEISELKQGIDKRFTEAEQTSRQAALAEMKREGERIISGSDEFELVRELGAMPDVLRLIERTYDETGEVMDVHEALQSIEEQLSERQKKLLKTKKLQGWLQPEEATPAQAQQRPQGMRTLTNKDNAAVPMTARQRAIAAFYGQLKK